MIVNKCRFKAHCPRIAVIKIPFRFNEQKLNQLFAQKHEYEAVFLFMFYFFKFHFSKLCEDGRLIDDTQKNKSRNITGKKSHWSAKNYT